MFVKLVILVFDDILKFWVFEIWCGFLFRWYVDDWFIFFSEFFDLCIFFIIVMFFNILDLWWKIVIFSENCFFKIFIFGIKDFLGDLLLKSDWYLR